MPLPVTHWRPRTEGLRESLVSKSKSTICRLARVITRLQRSLIGLQPASLPPPPLPSKLPWATAASRPGRILMNDSWQHTFVVHMSYVWGALSAPTLTKETYIPSWPASAIAPSCRWTTPASATSSRWWATTPPSPSNWAPSIQSSKYWFHSVAISMCKD